MYPTASVATVKQPIIAPANAEAVQQFEALLIGELASMMLNTVKTDQAFGGGHAEDIYRGMMAEHLGNAVAKQGGLNLGPALMQEVIRMQGGVS